jgi:hypothetical protein
MGNTNQLQKIIHPNLGQYLLLLIELVLKAAS